jgi:hypothetical protein
MTPDGEVGPRVVTMGSMWTFRSGLRPASYAGLSLVRAEPPWTDPYARWCGTRGWLSKSVTGTRFAVRLLDRYRSTEVHIGCHPVDKT